LAILPSSQSLLFHLLFIISQKDAFLNQKEQPENQAADLKSFQEKT